MAHAPSCRTLLAAATALGFSLSAMAQGSTPATAPRGDTPVPATEKSRATAKPAEGKSALAGGERKFVEKAARHGKAEAELGKLAQEKAQSPQVKEFGARMVQDHGKANEELAQIAQAKGLQVPAELDREHRNMMEKLGKLSGEKFDQEYMRGMVKDHDADLKEFRKQARDAKDADVKQFASKTVPVLEQHAQLAKTAHDAVRRGAAKK